jgi:hypothetical protein
VTGEPRSQVDYRRLAKRNLHALLRYKFLNEYGYDKGPVVVEAIVDDICDTVRGYYLHGEDLEPGQLLYLAPAKEERAGRGKTMAKTRMIPVRLTLVDNEDLDAIRDGAVVALRREIRVRRLTNQAYEQGAVLSQRDLSLLLGYSDSAISMTAVALRKRGEWLPLRGYVADMGSFPTHKAAIVRLYLEGLLTPQIAHNTFHSKGAVDRYIRSFEQVRLLSQKFSRDELPLLTGMPLRLIDEYLTLIQEHGLTHHKHQTHALSS